MPITALPTPPSRLDPVNFSARADSFLAALPQFAAEMNAGTPGESAFGLAQSLADASGASLVGFQPDGTGAVETTIDAVMKWGDVCVFEFMTAAEIAAVEAYTFATDVTAKVQAAMNSALAQGKDCYAPAGGYLVTGLYLPNRITAPGVNPGDDRGKPFRFYGQGGGNAFVTSTSLARGTIFKSVTDAPVLQDYVDLSPGGNGGTMIDHMRFDGNSTTAVVKLSNMYGTSSFHHNVIYQRGVGDGLELLWGPTLHIHENYSLNRDWVGGATPPVDGVRVGVGFKFNNTWGGGLTTFYKNTSRGWLTGYLHTSPSLLTRGISTRYEQNECSVTTNGINIANGQSVVVDTNYFEGGDGGIAINNDGEYSTICNNLVFSGYSVGIDDSNTTNIGSFIYGNTVNTAAIVGGVGIDVYTSGVAKTIIGNVLISTAATVGAIGIRVTGTTNPKLDIGGNSFSPSVSWTGAGAAKISYSTTNGVFGRVQGEVESFDIPILSRGALSLFTAPTALTQANVVAGLLTLPSRASSFVVSATSAVSIASLSVGTAGTVVIFRTTNANATFTDSSALVLAGGAVFAGPGLLTLFVEKSGATVTAYEVSRTVF